MFRFHFKQSHVSNILKRTIGLSFLEVHRLPAGFQVHHARGLQVMLNARRLAHRLNAG